MDTKQMEEILDLMIAKKVAGFEVGDFKVSFRPDAGFDTMKASKDDDDEYNLTQREEIDEELGLGSFE